MSDIRKWLKIMESVPPVIATAPEGIGNGFTRDATVLIDPRAGGGVGRFMNYTNEGSAMIDIKGVAREFSKDDFSVPERDLENGNDWFHMSTEPDTEGRMNDKPEFRPGDMVKIADVYGAVIGPGFGVFVGYGTTGEDCIVLFDGKQIVVPVENVASVLEQDAKDNFDDMDNDGNLSPMSFGSDNVKIEQPQNSGMQSREPAMDTRDEFSKWMGTVEEALTKESTGELDIVMLPQAQEQCGCGSWDCPVCFPDMDEPEIEFQSPVAATAGDEVCQSCGSPVNGHVHDDMAGMTDMTFPNQEIDELSKDTLASYIPKAARSASDLASRAAFALGGADENDPDWSDAGEEDDMKAYRRLAGIDTATRKLTSEEPMDFEQKPKMERSADGHIKLGDIVQTTEFRKTGGQNSPMTYGDDNLDEGNWYNPEMDDLAVDSQWSDSDVGFEKSEIIKKILYLQDLGVGKSSQNYTEQQLMSMNIDQLRQIEGNSTGEVSEDDMAPDMGAAPNMGSASGGGGYAPGTAPTMPESIQQGQHTMEDVDKDVAAMLTSLRKYDRLKESVAPVLGMRMISEKKPDFPDLDKDGNETETMAKALKDKAAKVDEDSHLAGDKKSKWSDDPKDHFKGAVAKVVGKVKKESKGGESDSEGGELDESEDKNSWEKLASDDKKDKEEAETKTHMGGTVTKTKTGLVHKKADESVEVNEEADPEVLTWMKRFANLGNMKGYGR